MGQCGLRRVQLSGHIISHLGGSTPVVIGLNIYKQAIISKR